MSFGNALAGARIDASKILTSAWDWSTVDAFLELHIEQGPLLEELGAEIGLVEKITGLSRFRTLSTGQADHAGTAAMDRRHDAGCAAAGTVLAVERIASAGKNARGTVGGVHFTPEAVNVVIHIAGRGRKRHVETISRVVGFDGAGYRLADALETSFPELPPVPSQSLDQSSGELP